jgi:hypothetical protein
MAVSLYYARHPMELYADTVIVLPSLLHTFQCGLCPRTLVPSCSKASSLDVDACRCWKLPDICLAT